MNVHDFWHLAQWNQQHLPYTIGAVVAGAGGVKALRHVAGMGKDNTQAHWATTKELLGAQLLGIDGVVLGKYGRYILRYNGPNHLFIDAGTQMGKTSSIVLPTLLEPQPNRSFFINDPNGELYAKSHEYREHVSEEYPDGLSKVYQLAPCSSASAHQNPLDAIRLDTDFEFADRQLLSETLVNPDGREPKDESDRHWLEMPADILNAFICYGLHSGHAMHLPALNTLFKRPWDELMKDMKTPLMSLNPEAHECIQGAIEKLSRMSERVLSTVQDIIGRALRLFQDPLIARMSLYSDFAPSELRNGKRPLSVYLCVPFDHMRRVQALVRIYLRQFLATATDKTAKYQYKLDVLLDEFPSLGRISVVSDSLNHTAGLGCRFILVTPSMEALIDVWGQHHNFIEGTHVQVYFGISDKAFAEKICAGLGTYTVKKRRVTYSRAGRSVSYEDVEKPLLTFQQFKRRLKRKMLIVTNDAHAITKQRRWYKHSPWKQRGTHVQ